MNQDLTAETLALAWEKAPPEAWAAADEDGRTPLNCLAMKQGLPAEIRLHQVSGFTTVPVHQSVYPTLPYPTPHTYASVPTQTMPVYRLYM
jgi:hypothetical protein